MTRALVCRWAPSQAACQSRRARCAATSHQAVVKGPPDGYSLRDSELPKTRQIIEDLHPELLDLVDEGSLVVVPRAPDYQERRTDGYQEPELIYVLGTSHLSPKSAADVGRLLGAAQPQAVVLELCRSRAALAYTPDKEESQGQGQEGVSAVGADSGSSGSDDDQAAKRGGGGGMSGSGRAHNPLGMSGPGLLRSFQRSMELGGGGALVLRLLLGAAAERLAAAAGGPGGGGGTLPGGEFRAARQGARAVGAQLVLGDRPIEITLRRALRALPWRRRAALAADLLRGLSEAQAQARDTVAAGGVSGVGLDGAKGAEGAGAAAQSLLGSALEELSSEGAVERLFRQLSDRYPELVSPLITERDLYLAWSLQRSKAVDGTRRVVGVVGRGHLRGVAWALARPYEAGGGGALRFRDLVAEGGEPGGSEGRAARRRTAAARLALETAAVTALAAGWAALQAGPPP